MDNYEPLETIGSGSFGIIRKVRRISDGVLLARKEIEYRKMSEKEKKQLVAEVNILRELRHPNIVRYYERFVDREKCLIYIIMELCEGGDLAAVIKRCRREKRYIPENIVWNLLSQLLLALNECHNSPSHNTILHRFTQSKFSDIKPDNVFLDKFLNVKLGDFGLSRTITNPEIEFAQTYVGTPFYMSPELAEDSKYNAKSDIWAVGCLIYELCALEPPFQAKTQTILTAKIKYSNELQRLIQTMFTLDYTKRPATNIYLKHDRIRLAIKEQELSNWLNDLKRREESLKVKEQEFLISQSQMLLIKNEMISRACLLDERELNIVDREKVSYQITSPRTPVINDITMNEPSLCNSQDSPCLPKSLVRNKSLAHLIASRAVNDTPKIIKKPLIDRDNIENVNFLSPLASKMDLSPRYLRPSRLSRQ